MSDTVIEVIDLKKTYNGRIEAVKGISFKTKRSTCFGLLGPNGAGKSTTLEMLQGILKPTSGTLKIFGMNFSEQEHAIRKRMGGLLQENKLYPKLRVFEAVQLFQSFYENPLTVDQVLADLQLTDLAQRYLKDLSGGQRQRVFLATALIGNPELLFLDEPTTGLDPSARQDFWHIITKLKKLGINIVLTTHYMDEAETLCDELIIIDQGRIIEQGTPVEIIERVMKGYEIPERPRRATLNDVFLSLTGRSLAQG